MDVPSIIAVCAIAAFFAALFIALIGGVFEARDKPDDNQYGAPLGKDGAER